MAQAQQTDTMIHGFQSHGSFTGKSATPNPTARNYRHTLENVELRMALDAQNLVGLGFETSVRRAVESIGAELLFNIPARSNLPFQRAALVCLPDENSELVLVTLSADGATMDAQVESPETAHLFRLGEAWLAVVSQFRRLS